MDQMFIGKVILIWILFSITFENYVFHISKGTKFLYRIVDIVYDVLCDKNKLFGKYINMPFKEQPLGVIDQYQEFTCFPNICDSIDGIYISLIEKLSRRYTPPMLEYYN